MNHTDPVPEFKENVHVNTVASSLKWLKRLNNPFNSLIIVTTDGSVECFSQKNKGLLWSLIDQESVYLSLDINYNSTIFACGQKSGLIDLYDMKKKKKIVQFSRGSDFVMGHVNRVASLKFLDDDINLLLSGGCDNMIYLWDIRAQDVTQLITFLACKVTKRRPSGSRHPRLQKGQVHLRQHGGQASSSYVRFQEFQENRGTRLVPERKGQEGISEDIRDFLFPWKIGFHPHGLRKQPQRAENLLPYRRG